jgi:hypothetical protein
MSNAFSLTALAILASACGTGSRAGGADAAAGGQAGAAAGHAGGSGAAGQAGGTGGRQGGTGGDGRGGAAGGALAPITGCLNVDQMSTVSTPCPVTCGNGGIDSCSYVVACPGAPGQTCPTATYSEICDGSALGTSSCESLGYAGGMLNCGSWCGFDTRGCDACEHGPAITGCVSAVPEVAAPTELALATTDTEIAIAWLDGENQMTRTGLRFARFRPDLSRLSLSDCFGPAAPTQVALAATPAGWLVAATAVDGLHVLALSPTGAPSGQERVIAGAKDPLLVGRPTGGPLLYWTLGGQTFVSLARADGSAETTAVAVFPYAIDTSAGVFTGDGFLLASRLALIWTTRIGTDGMVANQTTIQSTLKPNGYAPGLAWNGTSATISYWADNAAATGGSSLAWLRVDGTGAPLGAATVAGSSPLPGNSMSVSGAPLAPLGAQTIMLSTPTQASLQAVKMDATGAAVGAPFGLTHDRALLRRYQLGATGGEVIAAWTTSGGFRTTALAPGRIGLARLAP